MIEKQLIGFKHGGIESAKLFPFSINTQNNNEYVLMLKFSLFIIRNHYGFGHRNSRQNYYDRLNLIKEEELDKIPSFQVKNYKNSTMYLNEMDFKYAFPAVYLGRSRYVYARSTLLPDYSGQIGEISKYSKAFIYDIPNCKLNVFMKNFPVEEELQSSINIPYICSMNLNSMYFFTSLQKKMDLLPLIKRNHSQECMLIHSRDAEKPHRRKKK